ncbi:MAG: hypothetical protein K2P46_03330 [Alistipes sp.]|nr:hypothetical protein [Alistipes sp.]
MEQRHPMSDGKCIGGGYPPTKEYDVQEGDSMKGVVLLRLYTNRFFHVRTAGRRLGRAARRTNDTPMVSGRFRSPTKERTKDLQKAVEKLAEQGNRQTMKIALKRRRPNSGKTLPKRESRLTKEFSGRNSARMARTLTKQKTTPRTNEFTQHNPNHIIH